MAGSLNKVQLIGRLGHDPQVGNTQNGNKVVSFSLATSNSYTDKRTGEMIENTEWHKVVIFNQHLADVAEKYLKKGRQAYIEGSLKTRKWTDRQGIERFVTEVILQWESKLLLLDKQEQETSGNKSEQPRQNDQLDDEIPF